MSEAATTNVTELDDHDKAVLHWTDGSSEGKAIQKQGKVTTTECDGRRAHAAWMGHQTGKSAQYYADLITNRVGKPFALKNAEEMILLGGLQESEYDWKQYDKLLAAYRKAVNLNIDEVNINEAIKSGMDFTPVPGFTRTMVALKALRSLNNARQSVLDEMSERQKIAVGQHLSQLPDGAAKSFLTEYIMSQMK